MKDNITYLEDLKTVECPFKFSKNLLKAYQPERLSERDQIEDKLEMISDSPNCTNTGRYRV